MNNDRVWPLIWSKLHHPVQHAVEVLAGEQGGHAGARAFEEAWISSAPDAILASSLWTRRPLGGFVAPGTVPPTKPNGRHGT